MDIIKFSLIRQRDGTKILIILETAKGELPIRMKTKENSFFSVSSEVLFSFNRSMLIEELDNN